MPYRQIIVRAEAFLTHKGITVYRTYKNNDVDSGCRTYYFVLNPFDGEEESFDVRDLSEWKEPAYPPYLTGASNTTENSFPWKTGKKIEILDCHIKKILQKSIINGTIGDGRSVKKWKN